MDDTTCPVCGLEDAFSGPASFDICDRCGWEDDNVQRADPDFWGGANLLSLHQSQQAWQQHLAVRAWKWEVRFLSDRIYEQSDLGAREQVHTLLMRALPDIDLADPTWATLRRDHLYLEFVAGAAAQVHSMWVRVYGSGDAIGVLGAVYAHTGWQARYGDSKNNQQPYNFLDFGKQAQQHWHGWQWHRNETFPELLEKTANAGRRLIFTTLTEIRSSKPVAEFEDIRSLHLGEQRKP